MMDSGFKIVEREMADKRGGADQSSQSFGSALQGKQVVCVERRGTGRLVACKSSRKVRQIREI
jgi:hypothetical protein